MEKPIPDDYDLNAHSNWWKTVNGVDVENLSIEKLIDMLNHNISFREFTLIMILITQQQWLETEILQKITDKLDFLQYGSLPYLSKTSEDGELKRNAMSIKKLFGFLEDKKSLQTFVDRGLSDITNNYGSGNKSYFLWYLEMLAKLEMFEGNKNANHNDLLKGKILYRPMASWNPDSPYMDTRTLYEVMYLEPVRPRFDGGHIFEYNYKHKKDYYFRCKNGRPYRLLKLNITVNEFNDKFHNSNGVFDVNGKTIIWNFGIQNINPSYDRTVYSKLSGPQAETYRSHEFKSNYKTYFIPDNDVGRLWSKSKADILIEGLASTMNQELQHIDVLKNTSTVNYLSKQADLKYFGDVQDVPIMNLNDIDITGYKIKSKPIHFINWLKSNNPLGGGK